MKTITTEELKSKMAQDHKFVLVDVRGDEAFDEEHIPGAISSPLGALSQGILCCVIKGAEIIVYCGSKECTLSPEAARRLEGMGFFNVYDYEDGLKGWRDAGMKTVGFRPLSKVA